jgi:hypothetical protein
MGDDGPVIGIDDNDEPNAAVEVLGDLLADFVRSIVWRQYLEDYCPTPYRWPIVLTTMSPSEIAGVAMITSFMSFLASCFMSGVAEMT